MAITIEEFKDLLNQIVPKCPTCKVSLHRDIKAFEHYTGDLASVGPEMVLYIDNPIGYHIWCNCCELDEFYTFEELDL